MTTTLTQNDVRSIVLEAKLTKDSPYRIDAKSAKNLLKQLLDGDYRLDKHAEPYRECLQTSLRDRSYTNLGMTAEARLTQYIQCEDCAKERPGTNALYKHVQGKHVKGTVYECECGTVWRPESIPYKARAKKIADESPLDLGMGTPVQK